MDPSPRIPAGAPASRRTVGPPTAGAFAVLAALIPPASAGTPPGLPPVVAAAVADNGGTCRGRVSFDRSFVTRRDVNGDGVPDYVLDYAGWHCTDMPSGFCGSAGCLQQVFVSVPGGRFTKVFDENAVLSFFKSRGRPAMRVTQGGAACGRPANVLPCVETRIWNGRTFAGPR